MKDIRGLIDSEFVKTCHEHVICVETISRDHQIGTATQVLPGGSGSGHEVNQQKDSLI